MSLLIVLLLAQSPASQARLSQLEALHARNAMPSIETIVSTIRPALEDESPAVRQAALGSLQVRSMQSMWAGTRGPDSGPLPAGVTPPPPRAMIPADWRGDLPRLKTEFLNTCLVMLRSDPSDTVRHEAMLAALALDIDPQHPRTISASMQNLMLSLIRADRSPRMREEAVKTIRLAGTSTPEAIQLLARALTDPAEGVRYDARMAIYTSTAAPVVKVRFADARQGLAAALSNSNPDVRLGALDAFSEFRQESIVERSAIERLASQDPDQRVRDSAMRVAAALKK